MQQKMTLLAFMNRTLKLLVKTKPSIVYCNFTITF